MTIDVQPEPSFAEAAEIQRFWEDHYDELLELYPEKFVAVRDGEVVASSDDLALLFYALKDQGLDARTDVAIQLISSKSSSLLL